MYLGALKLTASALAPPSPSSLPSSCPCSLSIFPRPFVGIPLIHRQRPLFLSLAAPCPSPPRWKATSSHLASYGGSCCNSRHRRCVVISYCLHTYPPSRSHWLCYLLLRPMRLNWCANVHAIYACSLLFPIPTFIPCSPQAIRQYAVVLLVRGGRASPTAAAELASAHRSPTTNYKYAAAPATDLSVAFGSADVPEGADAGDDGRRNDDRVYAVEQPAKPQDKLPPGGLDVSRLVRRRPAMMRCASVYRRSGHVVTRSRLSGTY